MAAILSRLNVLNIYIATKGSNIEKCRLVHNMISKEQII